MPTTKNNLHTSKYKTKQNNDNLIAYLKNKYLLNTTYLKIKKKQNQKIILNIFKLIIK